MPMPVHSPPQREQGIRKHEIHFTGVFLGKGLVPEDGFVARDDQNRRERHTNSTIMQSNYKQTSDPQAVWWRNCLNTNEFLQSVGAERKLH